MLRRTMVLAATLTACSPGNRENSVVCGLAMVAGANKVLDQLQASSKVLAAPPPDMQGVVPARVVGYGTARAIVAEGPEGAVLGYEGEGFPSVPGFGLALVEDSADTFEGVLIFETDPPYHYPQIGTISGTAATLPLYGLRVAWGDVSGSRCPLFAPADTAAR